MIYMRNITITTAKSATYLENVGEQTFSRTAQRGLKHTDLEEAIRVVDGWYRANPTQLNKPVLSVVWREIAKPQFPPAK